LRLLPMLSMVGKPCAYVNTSIVIRALNPLEPGHEEARRLLEECCKKCRCVWSSVHGREGFRSDLTRFLFYSYLAALGAEYAEIDEDHVFEQADAYLLAHGLSPKRLIDVAHMVAAQSLECKYILARDAFMWRHANNFGLVYVNWETHGGRCPCPSHKRSGSRALGSGGRGGIRRASLSTSSSRSRGARSARRPGRSSTGGKKKRSPSRKPRSGSKSSQGKQASKCRGPKRGARRKGG